MTAAPVPLAGLLSHADWHDVAVLAIEPDHWRAVSGVTFLADVRSTVLQAPGHLVVVTQRPSKGDWHVDVLLQRAAAAGAAAVLLGDPAPLALSSAALASRLGLAVFGSDRPLDAALAARRMILEGDSYVADVVLRVTAAAVHATGGVEQVVHAVAGVLRRPVALVTSDGNALVGADLVDSDEDRRKVAMVFTPQAARSSAPQRVDLEDAALLVACPVPTTAPRDAASWLTTRLPVDLPAERNACRAALPVAAAVIGQRASLRRLTVERDARERAFLLGELLNAADEVSVSTRRRALDAGWRLDGWHVGVRLDVGAEVDPLSLRADVVAAFQAEGNDAVVVEQGDGWSAWISLDGEPSGQDIEELAARIRRSQRRLSVSAASAVGVGRAHAGPRGVARTLAEASEAARLASGLAASGRFLHVDRLGLAQTLLTWTRTETFQPAARSLLAPLHDQSGDLMRTLTTYLDEESSVAETAAILGIHRNTVTQRLARIKTLLPVDLTDPAERLAVHLACRSLTVPGDSLLDPFPP